MWTLARLSLRYHRNTLVVAATIALVIAVMVAVLAQLTGSVKVVGLGGLDLTKLWVLGVVLAQSLLIASATAGFVMTGIEKEEKRLVLLAVLPLSRREVSLHRALLPAFSVLLGTLVAGLIVGSMALLGTDPAMPRRLVTGLFVAGQLLFAVQLPLIIRDILERHETGRRAEAAAILLGLVVLSAAYVAGEISVQTRWLQIAIAWSTSALLLAANVLLFERRSSFG